MLREELASRRDPTEEIARVVVVLAAQRYNHRTQSLNGDVSRVPVHDRRRYAE